MADKKVLRSSPNLTEELMRIYDQLNNSRKYPSQKKIAEQIIKSKQFEQFTPNQIISKIRSMKKKIYPASSSATSSISNSPTIELANEMDSIFENRSTTGITYDEEDQKDDSETEQNDYYQKEEEDDIDEEETEEESNKYIDKTNETYTDNNKENDEGENFENDLSLRRISSESLQTTIEKLFEDSLEKNKKRENSPSFEKDCNKKKKLDLLNLNNQEDDEERTWYNNFINEDNIDSNQNVDSKFEEMLTSLGINIDSATQAENLYNSILNNSNNTNYNNSSNSSIYKNFALGTIPSPTATTPTTTPITTSATIKLFNEDSKNIINVSPPPKNKHCNIENENSNNNNEYITREYLEMKNTIQEQANTILQLKSIIDELHIDSRVLSSGSAQVRRDSEKNLFYFFPSLISNGIQNLKIEPCLSPCHHKVIVEESGNGNFRSQIFLLKKNNEYNPPSIVIHNSQMSIFLKYNPPEYLRMSCSLEDT
ncbi:hypothetical protein DICPUDRAFT_157961 [Dictyostelium purpureum]|uniref:Uncharacterized protein n=1 Tax=Dictyostelium purpureum TaxID=5786 RepID=F1A0G7_DICPU|nr:uncharacterized protein DICPUDRAFT_157961 [Dictyostelium purpureum]EGC30306.1 hypothetical protein DICPUDRAFT_157961 [Dictyostelium purpureum]|eukprot:XP_003293157.1 hypothetical protein DICPUDRAFT_157961 [Dictyostelium purpureum]